MVPANALQIGVRLKTIIRIAKAFISALVVFLVVFLAWLGYLSWPRGSQEIALPELMSRLQVQQPEIQQPEIQQPATGRSAIANTQPRPKNPVSQSPVHVSVVYSPGYLIDLGGLERAHPFDIKKYQKIHDQLKSDGVLADEQTFKPESLTDDDLLLIHTPEYLSDLKQRIKIAEYLESRELLFAPFSLDRAVLEPFRNASGGTLLAARIALDVGIGINIGGGYHHAKPDRGEGFCLYADVPIAIRKLQNEGQIKRAVIIDVDVHQGNGTILCLDDDDSTFTFSMHQSGIYPMPKEKGDLDVELRSGLNDDQYMRVLAKHLPGVLDESKADICFIIGGCDTLSGDPLASLKMTKEGIVKRDQAIVDACVKRKIPVVLTLSGGYSPDAWKSQYLSIKNLIETYKLSELKPKVKPDQ